MVSLGAENGDASGSRKPRGSNFQLLLEHDMTRQAKIPGSQEREYISTAPYPPSTKSVADLETINIAELKQDTRHHGKILFVRAIESGLRTAAVQTIVEDAEGDATRLALRNSDLSKAAEALLPEDALFAVKEPYFSTIPNGGPGIRIDHPSDLVALSILHPRIPQALRLEPAEEAKSAQDWKNDGNKAYGAQEFLAALRAYAQALEVCTSADSKLRFDVLRNRAAVNIFLGRFEEALADAKAAIIPSGHEADTGSTAVNAKAYERAGHAAYQLARFEEARSYYEKTRELEPDHAGAAGALQRTEQRLLEQTTGQYDLAKIKKSCNRKYNRLDHASFIANTTIRGTKTHGNGLFTTKDLVAGDLILVEKALCTSFDSDKNSQSHTIFNNRTEKVVEGTQATLLFKVIEVLLHNSKAAESFFALFDGGGYQKTPLTPVDGFVPIDAFRAEAIIEHNSYACPSMKANNAKSQKSTADAEPHHSTGFWQRASYINHACDGNAMRSFIGDLMIVRATKDVSKGEEILMPYRLPDSEHAVTQDKLQKIWGFKCDCSICIAEEATSQSQRKKRAQATEKLKKIFSTRSLSVHYDKNKADITLVENLTNKLRDTYDKERFDNKPRLALVAPCHWLCRAYMQSGVWDKVVESSLVLLRELGFAVTVDGQSVRINRQNCIQENTSIDASSDAAQAFGKKGDAKLSKEFTEFSRNLYLICNGEASGFQQELGKS